MKQAGLYDDDLVACLRAQVRTLRKTAKGGVCPVCDQYVKEYPRMIDGQSAYLLIRLVLAWQREPRPYSIHELPYIQGRRGGGDFAKLRYWGLIVGEENEETRKRASGIWSPTAQGIAFVMREARVPKRCYVYNGKPDSFSSDTVEVVECLGERFDYAALMAEAVPQWANQ